MAGRREKLRRVGIIPEYRGFTPDGLASGDAIDMTVDELEVLRLCDLEGLNQEAVALHMGIARGGALGDGLAACLDWAGCDVTREFYINDAGNRTPPSPRRRPHGQQRRSAP